MKNIHICTEEDLELTKETKAYFKAIGSKGGKIGGKSTSLRKRRASQENLKKARKARKDKRHENVN